MEMVGEKKTNKKRDGEAFVTTSRQLNSILDGGSVYRAAGTDRSCAKR